MKHLAEKQHQGNAAPSSLIPRVQKIRNLIGEQSLLLALPKGQKKGTINWSKLPHERMEVPAYLDKLESGNIAVILGKKSDDLCSIDFDSDVWLEVFLNYNSRNPAIAKTLRTRGKRGGNVWIRCRGAYPLRTQFLKVQGEDIGEDIGEWRAGGSYTVISGTHPEGGEYRFTLEAQVAEIDFASIKWPEGMIPPKIEEQELPIHPQLDTEAQKHSDTEVQIPRGSDTQETQVIQVVEGVGEFDPSPFFAKERGTSNDLIWKMAGSLLTWQKRNGRDATDEEKLSIFMEWYPNSRDHLDPAHDEESYMMKWLEACLKRRQADDESAVTAAWDVAQNKPLPAVAVAKYPIPLKPRAQKIVALCWHLANEGKRGFFLSCRDTAKLLEVSPETANTYLTQLSHPKGAYRILEVVKIGSRASGLATDYKFTQAALDISASAS